MTANDQIDGEERTKGTGRVPLADGSGNPNHDRAEQMHEAPADVDQEAVEQHSRDRREQADERSED